MEVFLICIYKGIHLLAFAEGMDGQPLKAWLFSTGRAFPKWRSCFVLIYTHKSLSIGLCASRSALGPVYSPYCRQVRGIFPNCKWNRNTSFLSWLPIAYRENLNSLLRLKNTLHELASAYLWDMASFLSFIFSHIF